MARPPRRSARPRLKLLFIINNFYNIILLLFIFQQQIVKSISSHILVDINLSQQQQQQLKFGDRLLPRYRQSNSTNTIINNSVEIKNILELNNNNNSVKKIDNNNNNNSFYENLNSILLNSSYQYNLIKNHNNNNNNYNINLNKNNDNKNNLLTLSVLADDHDNINNNLALPVKQQQDHLLNRQQRQHLYMLKIKKKSTDIIDDNIDDYNHKLNNNNDLQKLRRRYDSDITKIDHIDHINISKADRLIEMSTEFFIIPSTQNPPSSQYNLRGQQQQQQHHTITPRPILILASRTPSTPTSNATSDGSVTPPIIISTTGHLSSGLRKEAWVIPVLVFAALSMIMMAAFEIFVLFKAWRTSPSRRHLFLGQMLLLGLFACSGLGAVITAQPTILSCATIRFGVGVAYALVFAALLVKCVFLISLNGGVYLPAPYQGLLLLFAVLIQFAIGTQWLMTQPPNIQYLNIPSSYNGQFINNNNNNGINTQNNNNNNHYNSGNKFSMLITSADIQHRLNNVGTQQIILCKTQFSELLLSLIYIFFLIIFVAILAIKSRGIRDNYREATYIGLAIGGSIPIWLGWTLCGLAVADRHKDACTAFGLIATSATVFLVMFMPKGRQLAAMGKEGLYVEDREEQFSSLSRAGSGYSPSFFHFKPIKYGVMGPVPNSGSGGGGGGGLNGNINNNNSKQGANLGGGDRVALVSAAPPPTYTRMYHYFPAHMTHPFCFYPQQSPPTQLTQPPLPPLPQLKAIGSSLASTPAQIAQTLRYPGLFMRPDEANLYTTLEPTLSSNPNVFFQRSGGVHPGMMY